MSSITENGAPLAKNRRVACRRSLAEIGERMFVSDFEINGSNLEKRVFNKPVPCFNKHENFKI